MTGAYFNVNAHNMMQVPSSTRVISYSDTVVGVRPYIDHTSALDHVSAQERDELSSDDLCSVCLCRLDGKPDPETDPAETTIKPLNRIRGCGHVFCEPCIRRWLFRSHFCPVCKYVVVIESSSATASVPRPVPVRSPADLLTISIDERRSDLPPVYDDDDDDDDDDHDDST